MVNLVEDWEVLGDYAGVKQGLYQIPISAKGVEIRASIGRLGFKKKFESTEDPLLNRILSFCNPQRYVKVSENIRNEFFLQVNQWRRLMAKNR